MTQLVDIPVGGHNAAPLPPEPEASPRHLLAGKIGRRLAGATLCACAVAAPAAAAVYAVDKAPPVHMAIGETDVTAHLQINSAETSLDTLGGGAKLRWPKHRHVAGKDIGAEVSLDINRLSVVDPNHPGKFDMKQVSDTAGRYSDIKPELAELTSRLQNQAKQRAGAGAGIALTMELLIGGGYLFEKRRAQGLTPEAKKEHQRAMRMGTIAVVGAAALLGGPVLYQGASIYLQPTRPSHLSADPVLNNTPLKGADISGPSKAAVDQAIPFIEGVIEAKNSFTDHAQHNLMAALKTIPHKDSATERFVEGDDIQGRDIMARLVGVTAKAVNADYLTIGGDIAWTGYDWDTQAVDALGYYSGPRVKKVVTRGEHDSEATVARERFKGMTVGKGVTTQQVGDVKFLLVDEPLRAAFGERIRAINPKLTDEQASTKAAMAAAMRQRISQTIAEACRTHPDFALMHDKQIGEALAESPCAPPFIQDGRSYDMEQPVYYPTDNGVGSYRLTIGSTGALRDGDGPSIGKPTNPGVMVVMDKNRDTGAYTYRIITVNPDTSVEISPPEALSALRTQYYAGHAPWHRPSRP